MSIVLNQVVDAHSTVKVIAKAGQKYHMVTAKTGKSPVDVVAKKIDDDLHLTSKLEHSELIVQDFYKNCTTEELCSVILDSPTAVSNLTEITPASILDEGATLASQIPSYVLPSVLATVGLGALALGTVGGVAHSQQSDTDKIKQLSTTATITQINDDNGLVKGVVSANASSDDKTLALVGAISAPLQATETVQVLRNGVVIGTATVNGTAWNYADNNTGADATYAYTVRVVDASGITSTTSASQSVVLDTSIVTPSIALTKDTGASTSDKTTHDASITVSAPAETVTRTYSVDGGTASATYTVPTTDGSHTVVVNDIDLAGNTATASLTFTLDKTIATPTVGLTTDSGASTTDLISNDATLTIGATPAADVTRSYVIDGVTAASYTAPTADGSHTVVVNDVDTAGNTASASIKFTLDKAIATPTITLAHDAGTSATDLLTNNAALTVSAAASDVTRTYSVDGGAATETYTVPTTDGSHTVVVNDIDLAGNTATASLTFTLDKTIATPTVGLTTDSGASTTDLISNDATLTIGATPAADVTRSYVIDGVTAASYTLPTADGSHTVVVNDVDTAGNTASASITFTLDKTIATPTIALTNDTGASETDLLTNDAALTVSAAASDVTRTYSVDGGAATETYTAPTTDGSHTVVVNDIDLAGNTATASLTFTLDKTIATPTVGLTTDSGASTTDLITNDATLTIGATPAADVTRSYVIDGVTAASYTAPTADGSHTVVVNDVDTAGNTASATITFTLDKIIATPTITLAHDAGISASDLLTNDATLTVSAAASDVTRTYMIDGVAATSYVAPTTNGSHTVIVNDVDAAGNTASASITFTYDSIIATPTIALSNDTGASNTDKITNDFGLTISAEASDVTRTYVINGYAGSTFIAYTPNGSNTVIVNDVDTAGNTASASITFTYDSIIATPTIALSNDTGTSNTDKVTNDAALTISATASDVTRTYVIDGVAATSYVAPTTNGSHTVVVNDIDLAGNTATASLTFTLDKTIATPTVGLTTDSGASTPDLISNDATLTIGATPAADVTRSYVIDGVAAASYTAPTADGSHTVVVNDIDTAGNTASASITFTLDKTIATPTIKLANDTGVSETDLITNNGALIISAAASDVTRTYSVDGGAATETYTAPTDAEDGVQHIVVVTDTDTAGNTASSTITFTFDNVAPVDSLSLALTNDTGTSSTDNYTNLQGLTLFSIDGTTADKLLSIDGAAPIPADSYGVTTILADGSHTVVLSKSDTAGNVVSSAPYTFTLDTVVDKPTVSFDPVTSSAADLVNTFPTLIESTPTETVTREYFITSDADGTVTSATTFAVPTNIGFYYLNVVDTDNAGNESISETLSFYVGGAGIDGTATDGATSNTVFLGGNGDNELIGNGGQDYFYAGPGNDEIVVNADNLNQAIAGNGIIDGGAGFDVLSINESVNIDFATLVGHVTGVEAILAIPNGNVSFNNVTANAVASISEINGLGQAGGWTGVLDASKHQILFGKNGAGTSLNLSLASGDWIYEGSATNTSYSIMPFDVYKSNDGLSQLVI